MGFFFVPLEMEEYLEKIYEEAEKLGVRIPEGIIKHISEYREEREEMVSTIQERGIRSERVIFAMKVVPRHIFVPRELEYLAYSDNPLPIGLGQTISQPYITALMTQELELSGEEKVLEVGTGSGYHTSILALLSKKVITLEYERTLSKKAEEKLRQLGFENVRFVVGDGSQGFEEEAPYHRICVSAGAPDIPPPLIDQLSEEGIMIIPIGDDELQILSKIIKFRNGAEFSKKEICPCRFVKLKGRFGFR